MTLKEFMEENYPEFVHTNFRGGIKKCPMSHAFLEGHYDENFCIKCCRRLVDDDCESCWSQPYIETADTTEPTEKGE